MMNLPFQSSLADCDIVSLLFRVSTLFTVCVVGGASFSVMCIWGPKCLFCLDVHMSS